MFRLAGWYDRARHCVSVIVGDVYDNMWFGNLKRVLAGGFFFNEVIYPTVWYNKENDVNVINNLM